MFLKPIASPTMKTDTQLQQDVQAELQWEPGVQSAQIGVQAKDGVVTLTGEVASYAEKWHAEHAAQRVAGLCALVVALTVHLPALARRTDADIARAAENVVAWATSVPQEAVQVMVEGGWITLSGQVDWQYQRQHVADSLRYLPGVTGLSNQIALKPRASAQAVQADIESALRRRASADAKTITVQVHGSEVTLTGTVHSWSERDLAKHSAWSAGGVSSVVDHMTLVY
jgi:osmotically-inducible protein OsmY